MFGMCERKQVFLKNKLRILRCWRRKQLTLDEQISCFTPHVNIVFWATILYKHNDESHSKNIHLTHSDGEMTLTGLNTDLITNSPAPLIRLWITGLYPH